MKFYVASSFKNIDKVRRVSKMLKSRGYILTYDWTQNERASTLEELKLIGHQEKNAVTEADFIVVLLPAGKGSHIEFGIALGLNKELFFIHPTMKSITLLPQALFITYQGLKLSSVR
ncbi:hypothetical protein SAMN04488137_3434 [Fictibacillus solisalsi]|uniref:Nucleoside 2-deoxyribosyltransferase n=1 Tax=Fictibacillus solisalsi TaxID=459525 RepID=A0A1G9YHQ5_9BACL|nr:hypothetical protein SAMN04488137_3434 [Fictibacillus solisalsi]